MGSCLTYPGHIPSVNAPCVSHLSTPSPSQTPITSHITLVSHTADHPALLPTNMARGFFFAYLMELARMPAMADFTRALMSAFFGGDASEWDRALLMPHYSATGMPACSLHQVGWGGGVRPGCFVRPGPEGQIVTTRLMLV